VNVSKRGLLLLNPKNFEMHRRKKRDGSTLTPESSKKVFARRRDSVGNSTGTGSSSFRMGYNRLSPTQKGVRKTRGETLQVLLMAHLQVEVSDKKKGASSGMDWTGTVSREEGTGTDCNSR